MRHAFGLRNGAAAAARFGFARDSTARIFATGTIVAKVEWFFFAVALAAAGEGFLLLRVDVCPGMGDAVGVLWILLVDSAALVVIFALWGAAGLRGGGEAAFIGEAGGEIARLLVFF